MRDKSKLPKFHYFNGKKYMLKWKKPYKALGLCAAPETNADERIITVDPKLSESEFVETVIHEALHAEQWYLDEETVTRVAANLTLLLERLGVVKPE